MPRGTNYIHFMVTLSTFSYAVLFSSLALYLTNQLHYQSSLANGIVALFLALNFALHLLAGYIGSRLLNYRALLTLSILSEIAGIACLSYSKTTYLYLGLSFFLIGCGFGSTCLKCLLTEKFKPDDRRRDTAFFINYSAMNLGFFLGFIASGYFDMHSNYTSLFQLSILVNLSSLVFMKIGWHHLKSQSEELIEPAHKPKLFLGIPIILILLLLIVLGFHYESITNTIVLTSGLITMSALFAFATFNKNAGEKYKIYAFISLSAASIIFWMLFFVEPMGFTFFLKNNTNIIIFENRLSPQWFMNLNTIFVITCAPITAFFFKKLESMGIAVSIPKQFSLALILIALSFYLLCLGIHSSDPLGMTKGIWIVLHFITQSLGEVLIAPVGYALIGKLAPKNLQGIMMGFWMMLSGISAALSHYFSNQMTPTDSINPLISNPYYFDVFNQLGLYGLIAAMALFAVSNPIQKLITEQGATST